MAIEAVRDGYTVHDWFTVMLAITEDPAQEHPLATIHSTTARRYPDGGEEAGGGQLACAAAAERAGRPWPGTRRCPSTSPALTPRTTSLPAGGTEPYGTSTSLWSDPTCHRPTTGEARHP